MIHLYIQFYILKYFLNFILKGTLHNREKQPSPSRGASLAPEGEQGSPTVFSVFWYRQENLYKVISTTYFSEMIIPQFASFPLFSRSLSSIWIIFFYLKEILFCSKLSLRDPCLFFFFFLSFLKSGKTRIIFEQTPVDEIWIWLVFTAPLAFGLQC